jgi:hypothetical protein
MVPAAKRIAKRNKSGIANLIEAKNLKVLLRKERKPQPPLFKGVVS